MTKTLDVDRADQDATAAATAAVKAAAAVNTAEQKLASGGQNITVSALSKLRDKFRHAELAARGAHQRAERERAAARMAGLEEIGSQVDALAAGTGEQLKEALHEAADAVAKVRKIAADHDAAVADLIAAARDLHVEGRAPAGPRKTSAQIAVGATSITHKLTTVHQVGGKLAAALALAIDGKTADAADKAQPVTELAEPVRSRHYLRRQDNGMIFTYSREKLPDGWVAQLARGEMERLTERDIELYLAGEL